MGKGGCVYILTNAHHTVYYTGVTSDLHSRIIQHKEHFYPKSFTARYNIHKLLYFEVHSSIGEAILREKIVKKLSRKRKIELVKSINPSFRDLFEDIKTW